MTKALSLLLATAFLAACASQPDEPSYYLLRSDQTLTTRALEPNKEYALGSITIAPYIDQRGLVLETAEGEMRPARQHLWAEPVTEGARQLLLTELSAAAGQDLLPATNNQDAGTINIRIDQLHGTLDGDAVLVAYWWLDTGDASISYQFAERKALAQDGYAALARAEKALLTQLAGEIARTLKARSAAE